MSPTQYVFQTRTESGTIWSLPDGSAVKPSLIESLIADGSLTPSDDGLFPGESQTWIVRQTDQAVTGINS